MKIKIKVKIKSSGQQCPFPTGKLGTYQLGE